MPQFNSENNPGQRFPAGRSGNPVGRPRSIARLRRDVARELMQHGAALTAAAVRRAIAGDPVCLAACVTLLGNAKNESDLQRRASGGETDK